MITPQTNKLPPIARNLFWVVLVVIALVVIGYFTPHEAAKKSASNRPTPTPSANYALSDKEAIAQAKATGGLIPEMDFSTQPKETMERMRRCVRESGGDFSKLSMRDQRMFDSVTGGFGKDWLKEMSRHPENFK